MKKMDAFDKEKKRKPVSVGEIANGEKRLREKRRCNTEDAATPEQRRNDAEAKEIIRTAHIPLVKALLDWFAEHRRPLPWRVTYEPYSVWISEIMLQQTQMERGVAYYKRWMERFPTLASVAEAPLDEVLKLWEGLGYYARARKLHEAANVLMREYDGRFPPDPALLRRLPGVGEYTAGAVAAIAFNLPVPAVDANAERVFSRLFDVAVPCKSPSAAGFIRQMMESLIPEGRAREFIQAVMELGALVCKKKPLCEKCPLQTFCQAYRLGIVHERPIPGKKTEYSSLHVVTGVLAHQGRVFIQKRLDTGAWAGLWEFPGGRLEEGETPEQGVVRELLEETSFSTAVMESLGVVQHAYTRYKVTLHCYLLVLSREKPAQSAWPVPVLEAATEYRWVLPEELDSFALPAGHRKLLDRDMQRIMSLIKKTP